MFNKKLTKQALMEILAPLSLAIIIGLLAGSGAVLFRFLVEILIDMFWPDGEGFVARFVTAPWYLRVGIPALAGLIIGPVITFVAPELRGPGVPEVMEAMALRAGKIRHRVTILKSGVTAILIAAGASVGREGPIVQIGASIGSSLTDMFNFGAEKRRLAVACGVAAAISATFQAPMAGTLFVVEILLFDLEVAYLSNIVIAAVVGTLVSEVWLPDGIFFQLPEFAVNNNSELGLYLLLGIVAGLFSLLLMWVIFSLADLFAKLRIPSWFSPCIGGIAVGCVGLVAPQALGVGYEAVNSSLVGSLSLSAVLVLIFWKIMATGICLGSGMSGGVLAPSLVIGALLGSCFGLLAQLLWPDMTLYPAHYALIGMGAVLSGTTLAPITAIFTIFELTYSSEVILPLMASCIPSLIIVRLFHGSSIYETNLHRRGVHIVRGHDVNRLRNMWVCDYMKTDFPTLQCSDLIKDVIPLMEKSIFPHYLVLGPKKNLRGILTLRDLRAAMLHRDEIFSGVTVADLMSEQIISVTEHDNMETVFHLFADNPFSFMPVVMANNSDKAVGTIRQTDLVAAYDEFILKESVL